MDPNSQNQLWSKWSFEVVPGGLKRPSFADVKFAAAKMGRLLFGPTGAMKVDDVFDRSRRRVIRIHARIEGVPVHDPQYVAFVSAQWDRWAVRGFGNGTTCRLVEARLEAGDRQDGSPRDQLIILEHPAIRLKP